MSHWFLNLAVSKLEHFKEQCVDTIKLLPVLPTQEMLVDFCGGCKFTLVSVDLNTVMSK